MIYVDLILNTEVDGPGRLERVLSIDAPTDTVYTINCSDDSALPVRRTLQGMLAALESGEFVIADEETVGRVPMTDNELSPTARERRDRAWEVIEPMVDHPGVLDPTTRGQLITQRVEDLRRSGNATTKVSVYKYLRRYWQGGQVINALVPQWHNSGAPGRRRQAGEHKRGRKRVYDTEAGPGLNITQGSETLERLKKGYNRYIRRRTVSTLQRAYQETISEFFSDLPEAQHPTLAQFTYWMRAELTQEEISVFRLGERGHSMYGRPRGGKATDISSGPGSPFMLDETPVDIRLVGKISRRDIGRANIVLVIDVFSWLIVGVSVTLESPSWMTAVAALENMVTDKVEYGKRFGITITEEQWPSKHLPTWIYADRGVFKSFNSDKLLKEFKVAISNNPPRRPDLKGMVERTHKLIKDFLIDEIPGAILKERDGRYDIIATVDIDQLRRVVLKYILHHNSNFTFKSHALSKAIIRDEVKPRPISLWRWGLKNQTGNLRLCTPERMRAHLLPDAKATVTESGVRFRDLYYVGAAFTSEGWGLRAKRNGVWGIDVRFDPNTPAVIYVRPKRNAPLQEFRLTERWNVFLDADWADVTAYFHSQKVDRAKAKKQQQKARGALAESVHEDVSEARRLNKLAGRGSTKPDKGEVREQRQAERKRDASASILLPQLDEPPPSSPQSTSEVEDVYDISDSMKDLLEAIRESREENRG